MIIVEDSQSGLKQSKCINQIIIATRDNEENEAISELCNAKNVSCFRGSEDDVLNRFYQPCIEFNLKAEDIVIKITADCPIIDYEIIDKTIKLHFDEFNDYTSNTMHVLIRMVLIVNFLGLIFLTEG